MIVMLCTASRGGMRAVVESYRDAGLFDRHDVRLLFTHGEGSVLRRLRLAIAALARFSAWLISGRVELAHVHISMRGSFWRKTAFIVLARRFGVRVVGHLHGSGFETFVEQQPPWRRRIISRQLAAMDRVLVLGEHWRQYVLSVAPKARVVVLPNSVRLPPEPPRKTADGRVDFLFLGLVGRRKGVYELLEALAAARVRCPEIRLTIAGNGDVDHARQRCEELGLADVVHFAGWVDGAAKQELLRQADVYVLPSHHEGLPVSILEAMSWSLPIISTDVGAIAEVVRDGIDGFIVAPGLSAPLAEAIVQLAQQPELRSRMGSSARHRVADSCSEEVVLPRLERLYEELRGARARL